jgi:hypothetical protein
MQLKKYFEEDEDIDYSKNIYDNDEFDDSDDFDYEELDDDDYNVDEDDY